MATRPATAPEMPPSAEGLPLRIHSAALQPRAAAAAAKWVATKARWRGCRRQRRAGVEAEPADPEQAGADEAEHDRVRRHGLLRVAEALAEVERRDQRGDAGGDVHDGAAGEVEAGEAAA